MSRAKDVQKRLAELQARCGEGVLKELIGLMMEDGPALDDEDERDADALADGGTKPKKRGH